MIAAPRLFAAVLVLVASALLLPDRLVAQEIRREGSHFFATVTTRLDAEGAQRLRFDVRTGDIEVEGAEMGEVEVIERLRFRESRFSRDEVEAIVQALERGEPYATEGSTVRIDRLADAGGRRYVERDLAIRVPSGFGVEGRTSGGDMRVVRVDGDVTLSTSGGDLSAQSVGGRLDLKTSGGDLAVRDLAQDADLRTSGGDIDAFDVRGQLEARTSGGDVAVTDVQNDVQVRTSGGSIEVAGVTGAVDASTSGGDVEVERVTARVRAETSGGDVEVREAQGDVTMRTSGGDIEGRTLGGRVEAVTSAGHIELDDVGGPLDARTSVGDIRVTLSPNRSADYATRLEAHHGDIVLTLPADLPATIEATVEQVGRYERDDIYSAFPLSRETPESRFGGTLRSFGAINGGGPTITLHTTNGTIRIEKE
jgi:DUF4097 and DUF4098 domain-containing protein YvlB